LKKITIIGLGYVGLPLAIEFAKKFSVIGFDISEKRVSELKKGIDSNGEFTNNEILKMAMIETKEALENLDEIMSTPGLDGIYIGPADLSLAIGEKPGFDKGEDTKAYSEILRILEHAKKNNIFAGIHNGSTDYAKKMIEKGFQFVTVGADSRFISAGAKNTVENLKGTVKSELSKAY